MSEEERIMQDTRRLWLRISYWTGAIIDGLAGLLMFATAALGYAGRLSSFVPSPEYRYAMGIAAALMFGWTFLLLWGDRKPIARRGILALTVFPVITGIVLSGIVAVATGLAPFTKMAATIIAPTLAAVLMTFSYWNSRDLEPE
jgi:hypothetical protein